MYVGYLLAFHIVSKSLRESHGIIIIDLLIPCEINFNLSPKPSYNYRVEQLDFLANYFEAPVLDFATISFRHQLYSISHRAWKFNLNVGYYNNFPLSTWLEFWHQSVALGDYSPPGRHDINNALIDGLTFAKNVQ